ncbi:MAG: hypothetical protein AB7F78_09580 [Hyphomicrobiaceae bacterium]
MKLLFASAAAVAALVFLAPAPANAGDTCYPAVIGRAKSKSHSMREAYSKAIWAWEQAAEKKYDSDFDWYYSGDRTIDCKWKTGHDIKCVAKAVPCERHH